MQHHTNEHHTNEHHSHKRRIANSYRIFLVFPLALFYYEVFLRIFAGTNVFKHFFSLLFLTAGAAVFLTGITSFIPKKPRRISVIVLLIVLGLLFAAESVIRSVFKTYMTPANLLSGAGNVAGKYGGQLLRSIIFGIPKIVIFQVPAALYWRLSASRMRKKPYPVTFSAFFAVLGLLVYLITCLFISHGKFSALYGAQFTYNRATENFGLVTSTRLSIRYSLFGNKNTSFHEGTHNMVVTPAPSAADNGSDGEADGEENARPAQSGQNVMDISFPTDSGNEAVDSLSAYLETLIPTDKNAYTGLFEGKNLIMIAAESYCSAFITPELTPVLYRLTHNGFYFSDFYQPEWGGSTTTGETGIMTGLAPQWGDDSMILTSGNNNYFTMGNQLQRLGYSSCAFHNGSYDYYSRQNTHENLGYDQWVANETGMGELTGAHYSSDTMMMSATIDLYIDKQPFNIYYMTLSGHAPYKESSPFVSLYYDQVNAILGDQYEETTKYYICYQMELENALAETLRMLEEADFAALSDGGDGLGVRLYEAVSREASLEAILSAAKTKRYALARLRRMCWCAGLGLRAGSNAGTPPYARVLAANARGRGLLRKLDGRSGVPLVTKPAVLRALGGTAEMTFDLGARAHDLYVLGFASADQRSAGEDWRSGPRILETE